jgi:lipoprotein-releasing system ATP-binding protein
MNSQDKRIILKASQLKKTFHSPTLVEILKGIDIEVRSGETVSIVGKSGEGKSTLLHILGTLEKSCSGQLEICGNDTAEGNLPQIRNQHIGFIFQHSHLLEDETLLANVLMPAKIARAHSHPQSAAYQRALHLLEQVDLIKRAHFPAKLLSGGEKQRAAIARALCNDPDLILADEPSGNLDSLHSQEIHNLLLNLAKRENKSLIVVTHDREFAQLCDRSLLLKDGALSS